MDQSVTHPHAALPAIPHIDARQGGVRAVAEQAPAQLAAVMASGRAHYGEGAMTLGNRLSRRWLRRNENPYLAEIDVLAEVVGAPGVHLLNMSYEWTCTTSAAPDPTGPGARLLRTLDWPLSGLGRNVVVASMTGAAGDYENVTWPGFSGVATAMAPGRFAAALNQPPMRKWTPSCWFDWGVNHLRLWRRRALPPVHLLRRVFDTCKTYDDAFVMLRDTPLAMPAFFTLAGIEGGEACIIERSETKAWVRPGPCSVANHWISGDQPGRYRGIDSPGRFTLMETTRDTAAQEAPFDWLRYPILNETTRLSVIANPAQSRLTVQGWEADGPATAVFGLA